MSDKRVPLGVLMASALVLAGVVDWGVVGQSQAAPPAQSPVANGMTVPYSGQLSDMQGEPVADGAYDLAFALYATQTGGQVLWQETQTGVAARGGSFSVQLGSVTAIPEEVLAGDGGWLAVAVRGLGEEDFTTLAPRQRVSAAAVASSEVSAAAGLTCPHDHFNESWTGSAQGLRIITTDAGQTAVFGRNSDKGNSGTLGTPFFGVSGTASCNDCVGISGYATEGSGVYGRTAGDWGYRSGVYGAASNDHANGVTGWNDAKGPGVYAYSEEGVALIAKSPNGMLIEAWDTNIPGVVGQDRRFYVTNAGNVFADGTFTPGGADLAEMLPAVEGLEPGDVLVVGADGRLTRSTAAFQPTVVGVYSTAPGFVGGYREDADQTGSIPLAVIGVVPVKASVENGPVAPGDLLVTSSRPGHAMRADSPQPGTILGKALEGLDAGQDTGVIKALVTLQ